MAARKKTGTRKKTGARKTEARRAAGAPAAPGPAAGETQQAAAETSSRAKRAPMEGLSPGRIVHFADPVSQAIRPAIVVDVLDPVEGLVDLVVFCKPQEGTAYRQAAGGSRFVGQVRHVGHDGAVDELVPSTWSWPPRA